jgi:hypothetical protein
MNVTGHIEQDDLALYAMQLLPADETATIAQHLKGCAECRQELAAILSDLSLVAHTVELETPSALTRERLINQVSREKKAAPVVPIAAPTPIQIPHTTPAAIQSAPLVFETDKSYLVDDDEPQNTRSFASKTLPWVGWAIAAGLAVTATNLYRERNALKTTVATNSVKIHSLTADAEAARLILDTMNDPLAMRVTLQRPKTAPVPQARATYVADKGSLVFIASNMEPLELHKIYELWLIPVEGQPIPAGTFHPDSKGNASVILPDLPKGVEAKAFGITIEDGAGATTPTMPIIMVGT